MQASARCCWPRRGLIKPSPLRRLLRGSLLRPSHLPAAPGPGVGLSVLTGPRGLGAAVGAGKSKRGAPLPAGGGKARPAPPAAQRLSTQWGAVNEARASPRLHTVISLAAAKEATCCLSDGFQSRGDPPAMFLFLVFNSAAGKIRRRVYLAQPWIFLRSEPLGCSSSFFRIHGRSSWCACPDLSALGELACSPAHPDSPAEQRPACNTQLRALKTSLELTHGQPGMSRCLTPNS